MKAVLSAIPTYFMSVFRMPVGVIGRSNSAFLLERSGASGDEKRSSCSLDYGVSASIPGRAADTSHSTHQHSPPCQVGLPCDVGIGGHPLAGDQRGLRAVPGLG